METKLNKTDILITYLTNLFLEEIESNISIDDLISFLFSQSKNKINIISEDIKQIISLPESLLCLFEENLKMPNTFIKISGDEILNCFNDHSIFKTVNFPDVIVYAFDFSSIDEWKHFILTLAGELNLTEQQLFALNMLKLTLNSVNGLFTNFNKLINANLLLFNSTKFTRRTIEHELTHYLQKYTKFGLHNTRFQTTFDYSKLAYLNLSETEIQFIIKKIYNKTEFIPTIDNMISILNEIYKIYFKNQMSELEFIKYFQKIMCSKNNKIIFESDILKYWKQLNFPLVSLYLYLILQDISPKNFAKINLKLSKII